MKKYYSGLEKNFKLAIIMCIIMGAIIMPMYVALNEAYLANNLTVTVIALIVLNVFVIYYAYHQAHSISYQVDHENNLLIINMPGRKSEFIKFKDVRNYKLVEGKMTPTVGFGVDKIRLTFNNGEILHISPKKNERELLFQEILQHKK